MSIIKSIIKIPLYICIAAIIIALIPVWAVFYLLFMAVEYLE